MGIELRGVTKTYGKTQALRGIDLEISDGEFLSIVGPSGCGKTSLLRVIAGFTRPTAGDVIMYGRNVTDVPARRRGVGMVFQNYALFPNLNVYENVVFGLRAHRAPQDEIERKARALLQLVHMEGKEKSFPHQLSGGQQQRVAVARALAISPKVLLLDEPLSALDAKVRLELRYELKRIQRQSGITAVYVTHDQEEALSISDRVVVMEEGLVQQIGTPEEVYSCPKSRFVAQFVGVSNPFEAEAVSGPEGVVRWHGKTIYTAPYGAVGKQVLVVVRPEKVIMTKLAEVESRGEHGSVLEGTVLDRVFLGAISRFAVEVDGQTVYVDKQDVSPGEFAHGDRVTLWIERSAAQVIE